MFKYCSKMLTNLLTLCFIKYFKPYYIPEKFQRGFENDMYFSENWETNFNNAD